MGKELNLNGGKSISSLTASGGRLLGRYEQATGRDPMEDQSLYLVWLTALATKSAKSPSTFKKYLLKSDYAFQFRYGLRFEFAQKNIPEREAIAIMQEIIKKNAWPKHPFITAPTKDEITRRLSIVAQAKASPRYKNLNEQRRHREWSEDDYNLLKHKLETGKSGALDSIILMMLECTSWYGLRPIEWLDAKLKKENGQLRLVVRNAKQQSERQQEGMFAAKNPKEFREIIISKLPEHAEKVATLENLINQLELMRSKITNTYLVDDEMNKRLDSLQKKLSYVNTKTFGNSEEDKSRRISMYDMRHVFSMNAKQHSFAQKEVAAMMGHSRSSSTQKFYRGAKTRKRFPKESFTCFPDEKTLNDVVDDATNKYDYVLQNFVTNFAPKM